MTTNSLKMRLFKTAVMCVLMTVCFMMPLNTAHAAANLSGSVIVIDKSQSKRTAESGTIASDNMVHIKRGGVLTVHSKSTFVIKGRLKIDSGGKLIIRGAVKIEDGGEISCGGEICIKKGGSVSVSGELLIAETGSVYGKGSVLVNNSFSDIKCKGSVTAHIQPPKPVIKDGVTYVGGVILVNKNYTLPKSYGRGLILSAYEAYLEMKNASGFDMPIISDFRSFDRQAEVFAYWCGIDGYEKALTYSALPGRSEHQTGLALDISSAFESYGKTAEGIWLAEHCHEYGFIIRYPKGKEGITGYIYEPWHIRYLGKSTAKMVHDSGLTLEEFLGLT